MASTSRSRPSSRSAPRTASRPPATIQQYLDTSRRPLQILAFLLPLVIAYEIGLAVLLRSENGVLTNKAHETLLKFFAAFGVAPSSGFYLGGIAVVVVLLTWHLLARDPWPTLWWRGRRLVILAAHEVPRCWRVHAAKLTGDMVKICPIGYSPADGVYLRCRCLGIRTRRRETSILAFASNHSRIVEGSLQTGKGCDLGGGAVSAAPSSTEPPLKS